MIGDVFVVDAAVHGFNFHPSNYKADFLPDLTQMLFHGATNFFIPPDRPEYRFTWDQFLTAFDHQPGLLEDVLFRESFTDVAVYHGVPLNGIYVDGSSPLSVGRAVQERYPHRMRCYGPLYPWQDNAKEELDRLIEVEKVDGIKFYPLDVWDNEYRPTRMNDEATFEIVEHARSRGLKMMAFHKAVPLGPMPIEPFFAVDDAAPLARAFPGMTFEIVHGGGAFVEETAQLLADFPNIVINLESLPGFLFQMPERVVHFMELFLQADPQAERIMYASGAVGLHPQPMLEALWNFELPSGRMTESVKRNILGLTAARLFNIDIDATMAAARQDPFGVRTTAPDLEAPWSTFARAQSTAGRNPS
jgi:uncharacterized protein